MKRIVALLLAALLCMNMATAFAGEERVEEFGFTVTTPDLEGWTLLYGDEMEQRQALIEQEGDPSKGEPWEMEADSTVFVLFDETGSTELQLAAVSSDFSQDAYQLSRVPKDYKDDFIKAYIDGNDTDLMGYRYVKSSYYQHPQAEFIRYEMTWSLDDREIPMQKYYTVVNGINVSANLFCWDGEKSREDEDLLQALVDSIVWDEILEPEKEFNGYSSVTWDGALGMILGTLAICGALFAVYTYQDWRPYVANAVRKIFGRNKK